MYIRVCSAELNTEAEQRWCHVICVGQFFSLFFFSISLETNHFRLIRFFFHSKIIKQSNVSVHQS